MEGIAAERPGWHSLRRNGLAAGHGEASGIGIHVTSPWPPKTSPSRPVNGRTTQQIDTNETRPRFPVSEFEAGTRPRLERMPGVECPFGGWGKLAELPGFPQP
jgi:hypothetical protein